MSDTPRTDKYLSFNPTETEEEMHLAEFARELEAENAALLAAMKRLASVEAFVVSSGPANPEERARIDYARSAIAKAKGGQDE